MWRFWYPRREKTKIQLSDLSCWWKVKTKWWFNYSTFQIKLKYVVSQTQKEIQNCLRTMIRSLPLGGSIPHKEIITRQSLSQNTIVKQAQNILSQLPFHCGYSVGVGCWRDGVCTLVTKLQPLSPDLHPHHKKKQHNKVRRDNVFQQSFPAVTGSVQFEQEAFEKPYCSNDIFIFRWNWKSL